MLKLMWLQEDSKEENFQEVQLRRRGSWKMEMSVDELVKPFHARAGRRYSIHVYFVCIYVSLYQRMTTFLRQLICQHFKKNIILALNSFFAHFFSILDELFNRVSVDLFCCCCCCCVNWGFLIE
ncbi:hypothetical protein U1Q18_020270 [Sarracenia purpurea var. burkii]